MQTDVNRASLRSLASALFTKRLLPVTVGTAVLTLLLITLSFADTIGLDRQWQHIISSPASDPSTGGGLLQDLSPVSQSSPGSDGRPIAGGVPLRVMALGASVVHGDKSTGNVGFRGPLRELLAAAGNPVNMVGRQRVGAMADNDCEAYPGHRVDEIHALAREVVPQLQPNLFVVNMGSNDILQVYDLPNAWRRMHALIEYLFEASPSATVVMSTILTNTVRDAESRVAELNRQIRRLVPILQEKGRPIVLVEMHGPDGPKMKDITSDGTHPTDEGYGMMARIFMAGIREADEKGFVQAPVENGVPADGDAERAAEEVAEIRKMKVELKVGPEPTQRKRWT